MVRCGLLLLLSVCVIVAMGVVVMRFVRRLTEIERERWGRPMGYGRPVFLDRFLKKRRKGGAPREEGGDSP